MAARSKNRAVASRGSSRLEQGTSVSQGRSKNVSWFFGKTISSRGFVVLKGFQNIFLSHQVSGRIQKTLILQKTIWRKSSLWNSLTESRLILFLVNRYIKLFYSWLICFMSEIILPHRYVIQGSREIARPASSAQCVLAQRSNQRCYFTSLSVVELEENIRTTKALP